MNDYFKLVIAQKAHFNWQLRNLIVTVTIILYLFLLRSVVVYADQSVINAPNYGFSLALPDGYTQIQSPSSSVPVIIKAASGLPEFNIVSEPSPNHNTFERYHSDPSSWGDRIKDDYGLVGITTVEVLKSYHLDLGANKLIVSEINYSIGGINYSSIVATVNSNSHKLILTYKDISPKFSERRDDLQTILKGFTVTNPLITNKGQMIYKAIIILVILSAAVIILRRAKGS